MEVDMFASFYEFDEKPVSRPDTSRRLVITVYDDLVSDAEARNIAVAIQEYLDPELIEWKIQ